MDACDGGWDAGMSRGGKLGQRIPVFNWEWGQRGIREHIRFSATELGMILGHWISGAVGEVSVGL